MYMKRPPASGVCCRHAVTRQGDANAARTDDHPRNVPDDHVVRWGLGPVGPGLRARRDVQAGQCPDGGLAPRVVAGRSGGRASRGTSGLRADQKTPRIDLVFPSGHGAAASDFESWFLLGGKPQAAPLQVANVRFLNPNNASSSAGDVDNTAAILSKP